MKIAIDGPAGAGKSTIAKKVAKKMGYISLKSIARSNTIENRYENFYTDSADERGSAERRGCCFAKLKILSLMKRSRRLGGRDETP